MCVLLYSDFCGSFCANVWLCPRYYHHIVWQCSLFECSSSRHNGNHRFYHWISNNRHGCQWEGVSDLPHLFSLSLSRYIHTKVYFLGFHCVISSWVITYTTTSIRQVCRKKYNDLESYEEEKIDRIQNTNISDST